MKKSINQLLVICTILSSIHIYADTQMNSIPPNVAEKHPNHFYFGPEFLGYQLNTHVDGVRIYGTRFFWGMRLGYEYLKPDAFYAGVSLLGTSSETDFKASTKETDLSLHHADKGLGNLEGRLGYTLAPTSWLITPFLGLGFYNVYTIDHHNKEGFKENLTYVSAGVFSRYAFNTTFNIGINLKVFKTIDADQKFKYHRGEVTSHHYMWGGEAGIPFVWCVGTTKRWDIQLEPYFLKLDFSDVQNVYGTRLIFGYRF